VKSEILNAGDSLVTAALNGMYQGILLTVLVGLSLRFLGRTNAATRHAVWFVALLLVGALVPAQWCRELWFGDSGTLAKGPAEAGFSGPEKAGAPQAGIVGDLPDTDPGRLDSAMSLARPEALAQPGTSWESNTAAPAPQSFSPSERTELGKARQWPRNWLENLVSWRITPRLKLPPFIRILLWLAWAVVVSLRLALLSFYIRQIRALKRSSLPASADLVAALERRRASLGVWRKAELRISQTHRWPVVLGFVHPVILLPAQEVLATDPWETEQILGHELAHVQRRDDWANLVQQFMLAMMFFQPAVWWISRQLTLEREVASDDFALQQEGRRRAYARLLVNLAGRVKCPEARLAPGVSANKSQLQQRITMILDTHRITSPRLARARLGFVTTAAALAALLVVYIGPRVVLAQSSTAGTEGVSGDQPPGPPAPPPKVVLALNPPNAPVILVDDAKEPAQPEPSNIEPGPKRKPSLNTNEDSMSPPGAPLEPRAPRPPRERKGARVAEVPNRGSSLEERLDRLERMVNTLVAQQNVKAPRRPENELAERKQVSSAQEFENLKEALKRDQVRAMEESKRAVKEAEKGMKLGVDQGDRSEWRETFQAQIKILEKQRDVLQREAEKLQRQIERIQQERERAEQKQQRRSQVEEQDDEKGAADSKSVKP
jgi:beta-lactamase regulating signal transducer with metallopeptidase domain